MFERFVVANTPKSRTAVLGRAPPRDEMARLEVLVLAVKGVLGVHRLKAQQRSSQSLYVEMHIEVGRGLPIEDANDLAEEVPGPSSVSPADPISSASMSTPSSPRSRGSAPSASDTHARR